MGKYVDIFQKFMSLPSKVDEKRQAEFREEIRELLIELESLGIREPRKAVFITAARDQYANKIKERASHHKANAVAFYSRTRNYALVLPTNGKNEQKLRDYYHDLYYAAFYAARFALVDNRYIESTEHKAVPKVLAEFADFLRKNGLSGPLPVLLNKIANDLDQLKKNRNTADYLVNMTALGHLSSRTTVDNSYNLVDQIFLGLGI